MEKSFGALPTTNEVRSRKERGKKEMFSSYSRNILLIVLTVILSGGAVFGQTSGFTYQGRLTDGGIPANGNYDLQFALFDSLSGATQVGSTQTIPNVSVS